MPATMRAIFFQGRVLVRHGVACEMGTVAPGWGVRKSWLEVDRDRRGGAIAVAVSHHDGTACAVHDRDLEDLKVVRASAPLEREKHGRQHQEP
jgi:hypothetical protein